MDRLRQLAERLADQYHWQPAAAAAFVLADVQPNVATFRVTILPDHHLPTLSRVVIEVDPYRTPDEVAEAYHQVRDRLTRSRPRMMSEKHLGLGAFAAMRPPREPLATQMAAWNATVPDPKWRYETRHAANFARDRANALARLVHPEYQLPAREETISYDDFTLQRKQGSTNA